MGREDQRAPFRDALERLAQLYPKTTWSEVKLVPFEGNELVDWQTRINAGEISTRDGGAANGTLVLSADTPVVVAPEKLVMREWRFFVVDGKVITGSQYRTSYGLNITADVDHDVFWFATRMVEKWQPAKCFVLDVCQVKEGLKVVEVNCLNNSGCYACDLLKVFSAVEELYEGR